MTGDGLDRIKYLTAMINLALIYRSQQSLEQTKEAHKKFDEARKTYADLIERAEKAQANAKFWESCAKYEYQEAREWLIEIGMSKTLRYRTMVHARQMAKEDAEWEALEKEELAKRNGGQP